MASLMLLGGCAANTSNSDSQAEIAKCEIMYAVYPHPKSTISTGASVLAALSEFDKQEKLALIGLFKDEAMAIAKTSLGKSNGIRINRQEAVLGGYEGKTIPSMVLHTSVTSQAGYTTLIEIAANIGYVFSQDSTLVICDQAAGEDWVDLVSLNIQDAGTKTFFTNENIGLFFGLMIGQLNTTDDLGYTFYKGTRIFSTFSPPYNANKKADAVQYLAAWLNDISNKNITLNISKQPVSVFFPHNDWAINPAGEQYTKYLRDGLVSPEIMSFKARVKRDIQQYISNNS